MTLRAYLITLRGRIRERMCPDLARLRQELEAKQLRIDVLRVKLADHERRLVHQVAHTAQLMRECDGLRAERNHSRACLERASALIHGIHALLYPPHVKLPDGRTMAFRPSSLDPHEVLQELSDRIRALPDGLVAPKASE